MTQTICRMYANSEKAKQAYEGLKQRKYQDVYLITPQEGGGTTEGLLDAILKAYVIKSDAKVYADRVKKGNALVVVHAPFSGGLKAQIVLDSFDPVDSGVAEPQVPSYAWDPKTPASSALHMAVLTQTQLPFEEFWNIPSLMRAGPFFKSFFGFPLLSKTAGPLSKLFGMPFFTSSQTPLSSATGMSLLSQNKTPLSSAIRMPLLTRGR